MVLSTCGLRPRKKPRREHILTRREKLAMMRLASEPEKKKKRNGRHRVADGRAVPFNGSARLSERRCEARWSMVIEFAWRSHDWPDLVPIGRLLDNERELSFRHRLYKCTLFVLNLCKTCSNYIKRQPLFPLSIGGVVLKHGGLENIGDQQFIKFVFTGQNPSLKFCLVRV